MPFLLGFRPRAAFKDGNSEVFYSTLESSDSWERVVVQNNLEQSANQVKTENGKDDLYRNCFKICNNDLDDYRWAWFVWHWFRHFWGEWWSHCAAIPEIYQDPMKFLRSLTMVSKCVIFAQKTIIFMLYKIPIYFR